jgi:predicted nucleic acid-binding protein
MVVVSSIFGRSDGADASVVNAVATGEVRLAISDDQLSELVRVVGYGDIEVQISRPVRAFEVALDLGTMGFMYHPRRLNWPSLSDSNDGWLFDLAFASGADYIVSYDNAVHEAAQRLGFQTVYPRDLLEILRGEYET